MKKLSLLLFLLSVSFGLRAQLEDEKTHTFLISAIGGLGFSNYYFDSNSPAAPYTAPEVNETNILSLPFKINFLYHHSVMNVGSGLDTRGINFGIGVKRQGLNGSYYDYDETDYIKISSSFYKVYGRAELILIQNERRQKKSGFGVLLEGGTFFVRTPIGTGSSNGFMICLGGFYFHQLTDNLFFFFETSQSYDRYRSIINHDFSTHTLFTSEALIGLRFKI